MRKMPTTDMVVALAMALCALSILLVIAILWSFGYTIPSLTEEIGIPAFPWLENVVMAGIVIVTILTGGILVWIFPSLGNILGGIVRFILRLVLRVFGFSKSQGRWKLSPWRVYTNFFLALCVYTIFATHFSYMWSGVIIVFLLSFAMVGYQSISQAGLYGSGITEKDIARVYYKGKEIMLAFPAEPAFLILLCVEDYWSLFPLLVFFPLWPAIWLILTIWFGFMNPHLLGNMTGWLVLSHTLWWIVPLPVLFVLVHWILARGRKYGVVCKKTTKEIVGIKPALGWRAYFFGEVGTGAANVKSIRTEKGRTVTLWLPTTNPKHIWWPFERVTIRLFWDPGFIFREGSDPFQFKYIRLEFTELIENWIATMSS